MYTTAPISLRYGQVVEAVYRNCIAMPLPREVVERYSGTRRMAILAYEFDIVQRDSDGTEISVPLYDVYNHHHNLELTSNDPRASIYLPGAFDFRGLSTVLKAPYRHVLDTPSGAACASLHLINTQNPVEPRRDTPSPLLECPCNDIMRQRLLASKKEWRRQPMDRACKDVLTGNPVCSAASYTGGMRCCDRHHEFLLNASDCPQPGGCVHGAIKRDIYFKATIHYEDASSDVRHVQDTRCCGIAREFDVLPCAPGTPLQHCVRRFEHVVPMTTRWQARLLEVPYMRPHVHEVHSL